MFIRAVEIRIKSNGEPFGFRCRLERGLNIIKGRNSSGKSTLVNTLLYGLGLEELIGAKGERVLTSAVRDSFQHDGGSRRIDESAVLVEVQNSSGQIVTFRRPIRSSEKATKLIEAFDGALVTQQPMLRTVATPLFVHDAGSATYEQGFIRYFEAFLGMQLPRVQSSTGSLTRLYPQVIAAALFIEQKRGWTDYIASIPFYQILGAPTRVVQYLLGLDNFKLEEEKALNEQLISQLQTNWTQNVSDLQAAIRTANVTMRGIPKTLQGSFEPHGASLWVRIEGDDVSVPSAISTKTTEWHAIELRRKRGPTSASPDVIQLIEGEAIKLEALMEKYDTLQREARLRSSSLSEFRELLREAEADLRKNKTTRKLHELGASMQLATAEGRCPTCGCEVDNTLVPHTDGVAPMDLQSNIDYLEAQIRMLRRQIGGLERALSESGGAVAALAKEISEQRKYVVDLRKNVSQSDATLEADVRKQISLESDIRMLQAAQSRLVKFLEDTSELPKQLADALAAQKNFPSDLYSKTDHIKISLFEKNFRANAQSFGYTSAEINEVRINPGSLLPALGDITLRAVFQKNVKSESSASDFVRLIWAFLLAIYQTSSSRDFPGNHPGILLFDEPGQHSMSEHSQKALINILSGSRQLQSVVAASFDESAQLFEEVTEGSKFHLIDLPEKIISRLNRDDHV